MIEALRKLFVSYCAKFNAQGMSEIEAAEAVAAEVGRPWMRRGMVEFFGPSGMAQGDTQAAFVLSQAFEAGAHSALRLAHTVLSDPAIRGRELAALELLEVGAGHAEVLACIRAQAEAEASGKGSVVLAFPSRGGGRGQ